MNSIPDPDPSPPRSTPGNNIPGGAVPPAGLIDRLRAEALRLGFDLLGIAPAVTPTGVSHLVDWIEAGYAAEMNYFRDRLDAYADPGMVLAGVRSVIVMTFPYSSRPRSRPQNTDADASKAYGKIARYAWGSADYHDLIHPRLETLKQMIREACPQARSRGVVDTAPLMEREFAQLAGLGWAGKNSLLLNKRRGSYFFLACLLTTLELPASAAASAHCGTCTRCLDACPTDAFPAPGVVDSRRCISYLTIEHRGPIPTELRAGIGDWLFGCDICQEVCPWNAKAQRVTDTDRGVATELVSRPASDPVDLADILALDETAFRARFRDTPLWRPRRRGILRNAAICAGNARAISAAPALITLLNDPDPLIRGAAAWALGQIGNQQTPLENRLRVEDDTQVRDELTMALAHAPTADR